MSKLKSNKRRAQSFNTSERDEIREADTFGGNFLGRRPNFRDVLTMSLELLTYSYFRDVDMPAYRGLHKFYRPTAPPFIFLRFLSARRARFSPVHPLFP